MALIAAGYLAGCGPNKGERWADKTNEKVVAKIKEGKIKTEYDLASARLDAMLQAKEELKLETMTQGEMKKFDEKMAKYEEEWKKLMKENPKG